MITERIFGQLFLPFIVLALPRFKKIEFLGGPKFLFFDLFSLESSEKENFTRTSAYIKNNFLEGILKISELKKSESCQVLMSFM